MTRPRALPRFYTTVTRAPYTNLTNGNIILNCKWVLRKRYAPAPAIGQNINAATTARDCCNRTDFLRAPSAGHWRLGTRPRPRLVRPCRRSRAALRRAQLDEVRQARLPMPGRWKRRRVQTGRNTRRMTAAHKGVLHDTCLDLRETALTEQLF